MYSSGEGAGDQCNDEEHEQIQDIFWNARAVSCAKIEKNLVQDDTDDRGYKCTARTPGACGHSYRRQEENRETSQAENRVEKFGCGGRNEHEKQRDANVGDNASTLPRRGFRHNAPLVRKLGTYR